MGKQAKLRAKRRELRVYVNQASITPTEASEAMRRAKGRSTVALSPLSADTFSEHHSKEFK